MYFYREISVRSRPECRRTGVASLSQPVCPEERRTHPPDEAWSPTDDDNPPVLSSLFTLSSTTAWELFGIFEIFLREGHDYLILCRILKLMIFYIAVTSWFFYIVPQ